MGSTSSGAGRIAQGDFGQESCLNLWTPGQFFPALFERAAAHASRLLTYFPSSPAPQLPSSPARIVVRGAGLVVRGAGLVVRGSVLLGARAVVLSNRIKVLGPNLRESSNRGTEGVAPARFLKNDTVKKHIG